MATNHFFVPASSIDGEQVRLSAEQAHQVSHVLRLKPGDVIVVLDDSGVEYDVTLTSVGPRETVGQVTDKHPASGEPTTQLTLFQSLLAREKFEWVLQKGTEVGVARFVPVLTERSIVRDKRIEENKLNRWRHIVTEAAEQSHRGRIPKLDQTVAFDEAIRQSAGFDRCLIAVPFHKAALLRDALRSSKKDLSVALMIGPEGGFTQEEVAAACERGAVPICLGPRVLRTETAAVVAAALILYELGEMGP
jgi:16S rRNA (uracil1498-N3)-methyltransferase